MFIHQECLHRCLDHGNIQNHLYLNICSFTSYNKNSEKVVFCQRFLRSGWERLVHSPVITAWFKIYCELKYTTPVGILTALATPITWRTLLCKLFTHTFVLPLRSLSHTLFHDPVEHISCILININLCRSQHDISYLKIAKLRFINTFKILVT